MNLRGQTHSVPPVWVFHLVAIFIVVSFFSNGVYSLSVDVAHHFILADFLSQSTGENIHDLSAMAQMAYYPDGSHWIAVAIGQIVGSNYKALSIVSIASAYILYVISYGYFLRFFGFVSFLALFTAFIVTSFSKAVFGYENVGNFFYSQIVATVPFFVTLFYITSNKASSVKIVVFSYFSAILTAYLHLLPALSIVATTCFYLLLTFVLDVKGKRLRSRELAVLVVFAVISGLSLYLHPSFAKMRMLSLNDGGLNFATQAGVLFGAAAIVAVWQAVVIFRKEKLNTPADVVIFSALLSSLTLVSLQYMSTYFGEGSYYAVKKHFFILVPLATMSLSRLLSGGIGKSFSSRSTVPVVIAAALSVWWVYPARPIIPLASVTQPLRYAQHLSEFELPFPADGRVGFLAASVDSTTRYMISLAAFRVAVAPALDILRGELDPSAFDYAVIDVGAVDVSGCEDIFGTSAQFVTVSSDCLVDRSAVRFNHNSLLPNLFAEGWSIAEDHHRWSDGPTSRLQIPLTETSAGQCALINGYTFGPQSISASVGTLEIFSKQFEGDAQVVVPIDQEGGDLNVVLNYSNASNPGEGSRLLAFALRDIRIGDCPETRT